MSLNDTSMYVHNNLMYVLRKRNNYPYATIGQDSLYLLIMNYKDVN